MKLQRHYTSPGENPLDKVVYEKRPSIIANPDGSVVFETKDAEVPKGWSQLATDIIVSKYFRRAGVPTEAGRETSARQVVLGFKNHRPVGLLNDPLRLIAGDDEDHASHRQRVDADATDRPPGAPRAWFRLDRPSHQPKNIRK